MSFSSYFLPFEVNLYLGWETSLLKCEICLHHSVWKDTFKSICMLLTKSSHFFVPGGQDVALTRVTHQDTALCKGISEGFYGSISSNHW